MRVQSYAKSNHKGINQVRHKKQQMTREDQQEDTITQHKEQKLSENDAENTSIHLSFLMRCRNRKLKSYCKNLSVDELDQLQLDAIMIPQTQRTRAIIEVAKKFLKMKRDQAQRLSELEEKRKSEVQKERQSVHKQKAEKKSHVVFLVVTVLAITSYNLVFFIVPLQQDRGFYTWELVVTLSFLVGSLYAISLLFCHFPKPQKWRNKERRNKLKASKSLQDAQSLRELAKYPQLRKCRSAGSLTNPQTIDNEGIKGHNMTDLRDEKDQQDQQGFVGKEKELKKLSVASRKQQYFGEDQYTFGKC